MNRIPSAILKTLLASAIAAIALPASAHPCDESILTEMAKGEGNPSGERAACFGYQEEVPAPVVAQAVYACDDWLIRQMAQTDGNPDGYFGACYDPKTQPVLAGAGEDETPAQATVYAAYACDDWFMRQQAQTDGNPDGYFGACYDSKTQPLVARVGELAANEQDR